MVVWFYVGVWGAQRLTIKKKLENTLFTHTAHTGKK